MRRPWVVGSIQTQSVKVPPVSIAMRRGGECSGIDGGEID
jgi:hypothetical protein